MISLESNFEQQPLAPQQEKKEPTNELFLDEHEHIVDIEAPEIKEKIKEAREIFQQFYFENVKRFDLGLEYREQAIDRLYEKVQEQGIFTKAKEIRELLFNKNISIYGVCYLSNKCGSNQCTFCPMGRLCREQWELEQDLSFYHGLDKDQSTKLNQYDKANMASLAKDLARIKKRVKALSPFEAAKDLQALGKIGHKEICVLAGEELAPDKKTKAIKSANDPDEIIKYTQMALNVKGVKEVILNIGAFSKQVFRYIQESLKIPPDVKLQFRVFQETYNRDAYADYLRFAPEGCHNKKDFDFRYNSQINALKAGFDEVGIGVLFGLSSNPLEEIYQLQQHADNIKELGGKEPKRCCLPIANDPNYDPEAARLQDLSPKEQRREILSQVHQLQEERRKDPHPDDSKYMQKLEQILRRQYKRPEQVEIKYYIPGLKNSQKAIELIYALARLAMPTISIVSSERDNPETLEVLDQYANHTTLNVHPYPGGNIEALKELQGSQAGKDKKDKPIEQAESFSRNPSDAIKSWQSRGYHILGFDVEEYQT